MAEKGWRLYGSRLINKRGSNDPRRWLIKKPTFQFVRRATPEEVAHAQKVNKSKSENWAIFRCKQNGQLIGKEYRSK